MKNQMAEQEVLIQNELSKKEVDDFDWAFSKMLQTESQVARKDPKNMFMMN